jgi:AhpD family alkylhydroperoxidase
MPGVILRAALGMTPSQFRRVTPAGPGAPGGIVASVYAQVKHDFGVLAPPITLHSPSPQVLAAAWIMLRETLLAAGRVDRATKEAIAAAVSVGNACPYCVDVHSATLHGLIGGQDAVAISEDRIGSIADAGLRRIAAWARSSSQRELVARHEVPVPPDQILEQIPELIGVTVTFHYFNRMVSVFLTDSPFPPGIPKGARGGAFRVFGRLMRPAVSRALRPGLSLSLLPRAALPPDLRWAVGSGCLESAFGRATTAVDQAGQRSVPEPVRELVGARLAGWNGQPAGLSRSWVEDAVAGLAVRHRSAGRLALLAAIAPHQIDEAIVDQFRHEHPHSQDTTLVELVSWASLAASRQVGSWLWDEAASRLRAVG